MTKDSKDHADLRNYDVRHVERALKSGQITRKDYEKILKALPDVKDKAAPMADISTVGDDDDDGR